MHINIFFIEDNSTLGIYNISCVTGDLTHIRRTDTGFEFTILGTVERNVATVLTTVQ